MGKFGTDTHTWRTPGEHEDRDQSNSSTNEGMLKIARLTAKAEMTVPTLPQTLVSYPPCS